MESNGKSPLEIDKSEFKAIGHQLVDRIADFIGVIGDMPVTTKKSQNEVRQILGNQSLRENGMPAEEILSRGMDLLTENSLFTTHPKFMGYIIGSASPISALADFIAAAMNPNLGAQILSPMATEIEKQTIHWLLEFIGLPTNYGGILVSGGNMANFTCFFAALNAKLPKEYQTKGLAGLQEKVLIYGCSTTHTWIEKAAKISGLGIDSIRYVEPGEGNQMDCQRLESLIEQDGKKGYLPIMVVGSAGDVSTGAIDDIKKLTKICAANDLWLHVDGAYGLPAVAVPSMKPYFEGLEEVDSLALDPHKWLYNAHEVGCALVKNPKDLLNTYSSKPDYYNFEDESATVHNFYEYGFQNSRGFRAFKLWATFQQAGRQGFIDMIRANIEQSMLMAEEVELHPELQRVSQNLSITNFRFVPLGTHVDIEQSYLNRLNQELLTSLQKNGDVFLSNAVIDGKYCLRSCIVNFRTTIKDIIEILGIVVREGRKKHNELHQEA